MAEPQPQRMTIEEFLDWQLKQEKLYELVDGLPLLPLKMMTGATHNHDTIVVNALTILRGQLRGERCRPKSQDIGVRIPKGNIRRPDVLVDCGSPRGTDMVAADPRVVIEVLSPSTTNFDRFKKLPEYMTVPSLAAILLVNTEAPHVTVYRRSGAEWIDEDVKGLASEINRLGIEATLPMAELYDGVQF